MAEGIFRGDVAYGEGRGDAGWVLDAYTYEDGVCAAACEVGGESVSSAVAAGCNAGASRYCGLYADDGAAGFPL